MKRLGLIILVLFGYLTACNRAPDHAASPGSTEGGGGSIRPVDSTKALGVGVNGESDNTLGTTDTVIPGHSVAAPKGDTINKKNP